MRAERDPSRTRRRTHAELRREATAYHEAGHVIAAIYVSGPWPHHVSIVRTEEHWGVTRSNEAVWVPGEGAGIHRYSREYQLGKLAQVERHAKINLAGHISQTRFARHAGRLGGYSQDLINSHEILQPFYPHEVLRSVALEFLIKDVRRFMRIPQMWDATTLFASRLLDHDELEGEALDAVLGEILPLMGPVTPPFNGQPQTLSLPRDFPYGA